jgi:hypothetical protein
MGVYEVFGWVVFAFFIGILVYQVIENLIHPVS